MARIKRFLLFQGSIYYPNGGWDDFVKSFNSKEEAQKFAEKSNDSFSWYHILDFVTYKIVSSG